MCAFVHCFFLPQEDLVMGWNRNKPGDLIAGEGGLYLLKYIIYTLIF
jgi:hypothetical protein